MASDLLGTLYKAMSGLNAFTRGLDNLSNNVANLNTTGWIT
jgi:flagellar hook protein FlgE